MRGNSCSSTSLRLVLPNGSPILSSFVLTDRLLVSVVCALRKARQNLSTWNGIKLTNKNGWRLVEQPNLQSGRGYVYRLVFCQVINEKRVHSCNIRWVMHQTSNHHPASASLLREVNMNWRRRTTPTSSVCIMRKIFYNSLPYAVVTSTSLNKSKRVIHNSWIGKWGRGVRGEWRALTHPPSYSQPVDLDVYVFRDH